MAEHSLLLVDRQHMDLSGVSNVNTFDEKEIIVETALGYLYLKGENMHISMLSLDEGKVTVDGTIHSIEYKAQATEIKTRGKNIINRLLK